MSLMFVCAKEDEQGPERTHDTSTVMVRCPRHRKHAVGGYWCQEEGCEHQRGRQLWGHGKGKCDPSPAATAPDESAPSSMPLAAAPKPPVVGS